MSENSPQNKDPLKPDLIMPPDNPLDTPDNPVGEFDPSTPLNSELGAISLETLQAGIDRGGLAVLGLRRAITEARLRRAEKADERADELMDAAAIRGGLAEAARDQELPKDKALRQQLVPVTRSELRNVRRTARQRTKVMNANAEAVRLRSNYGGQDMHGKNLVDKDVYLSPYHNADVLDTLHKTHKRKGEEYPEIKHAAQQAVSARKASNILPNDLGTPEQLERLENGRYPRGRIRAELRAARQLRRTERIAERYGDRIQKTIDGKDRHGRKVRKQVESTYDRVDKLTNRLLDLEQRTEQKREVVNEHKEERKIARNERREKRKVRREATKQKTKKTAIKTARKTAADEDTEE